MTVGVCASHTKLCLIESKTAGKTVMAGSANLSSSDNLEQFVFTHDNAVYDYCESVISGILRDFAIYDGRTDKARFELKGNRGAKLADKVEAYAEGADK